jgi:4-diphosphocytidyl-2-C-methyl-D-erythritol kinase
LSTIRLPAPAKVNLFLAVTGRRADGFHDLVSLVVPLDWGDTLEAADGGGSVSVESDSDSVPRGRDNLVAKAAAAFAEATGWDKGGAFFLQKRIPAGAGLGGASSDAASALTALNRMAGEPLGPAALAKVAAAVGSDCPLFLSGAGVVMRGRGEVTLPLGPAAQGRLRGARLLLFKPTFSVATPWAYGRLAASAPSSYCDAAWAEERLGSWLADPPKPLSALLFNSMDAAVFPKYPALPVLLGQLRKKFGVDAAMTGSGSACFAVLGEGADAGPVADEVRGSLGPSAFVQEARIA